MWFSEEGLCGKRQFDQMNPANKDFQRSGSFFQAVLDDKNRCDRLLIMSTQYHAGRKSRIIYRKTPFWRPHNQHSLVAMLDFIMQGNQLESARENVPYMSAKLFRNQRKGIHREANFC